MKKPLSKGIVAAGHHLTAKAGADILSAGGTAVDAAIAALAMSFVCEPVLSSPGGGGFAMLRDETSGETSLIDFFPQTPLVKRQDGEQGVAEIHADFGTALQAFHIGPATAATPGMFDGIVMLHEKHGTMELSDLFAAAIKAAQNGIAVTPFQHYLSTVVKPILVATKPAAELFAPGGEVIASGGIYNNPGLANALIIMAKDGFSGSEIGKTIITMQQEQGNLTFDDLAAYRAIERMPLKVAAEGCDIYLNPLPAASGTLIAHSLAQLQSPGAVHLAKALDVTDRARRNANGDLASLITSPLRQRGTTHISIIDGEKNACAVTVSNGEGNGELVGDFGFMLNNILGEEDVNPSGTADWPVDTRLASMMSPTLMDAPDGGIVALGSGGSNRIRSALLQVILQYCLLGTDLTQAVSAPRMHVEGGHLDFEDHFDDAMRQQICDLFPDHRAWAEPNMYFGGVHAAGCTIDNRFFGVGDSRRAGSVVIAD